MRLLHPFIFMLIPLLASPALAGSDAPTQTDCLPPPIPTGEAPSGDAPPPAPSCTGGSGDTVNSPYSDGHVEQAPAQVPLQKGPGASPEESTPGAGVAFFTTLPGILTGLAALVTAIAGVLVVRNAKKKPDRRR